MWNDKSPVGNTCGMIDDVISYLNSMNEEPLTQGEIKTCIDLLEEIRSHNVKLREWGNEEYERAEEIQSELDEKTDFAEKMETLASELEEELKEIREMGLDRDF